MRVLAVAVGAVETVRVQAFAAAGELHPVAPAFAREGLDELEKGGTDATSTKVRAHVDGLDLGAPSPGVLEVSKHDDLAHAHHVTIENRHHDFTTSPTRLEHGLPVLIEPGRVLGAGAETPLVDQRHGRDDLVTFDTSQHHIHTATLPEPLGLEITLGQPKRPEM